MPFQKLRVRQPIQGIATGPPIKPFLPDPFDALIELPNTAGIRRASVILIVASKLPVERVLLLLNRIMPMLPAPHRHCLKAAPEPLPHRVNMNREFPPPGSLADMRESKKIESCRLRSARLF